MMLCKLVTVKLCCDYELPSIDQFDRFASQRMCRAQVGLLVPVQQLQVRNIVRRRRQLPILNFKTYNTKLIFAVSSKIQRIS